MKNKKRRFVSILMLFVLAVALCGTALAEPLNTSEYDYTYLNQGQLNQVQGYQQQYLDAQASGDAAAMAAAHAAAEAVRAGSAGGGYSGGSDGSEYIPFGQPYVPPYYPPYVPPYVPPTYSISASAASGGSISPSGAVSISEGGSQTYTITANSGYKISSVSVDGASVGVISTYTFSNVTSAHSISATFASDASLNAGGVSLGDAGSGTLKAGNVTKTGYGFTASLSVNAVNVTNTTVTAAFNFGTPQSVSLQYVDGTWQFPVNSASPIGARKIYIPVDTKNGSYTVTFTVTALDPQESELQGHDVYLTSTQTATITINGTMYDDSFTGIN